MRDRRLASPAKAAVALFMVSRGMAKRRLFCNELCRSKFHNEKHYMRSDYAGVCPGTVGAISELRVCVDLMRRGFEVFRSQSPHAKSDLVFIVERLCYRVAVKTAYRNPGNGKICYPQEKGDFDIFALALPRQEIIYLSAEREPIDIDMYRPTQSAQAEA